MLKNYFNIAKYELMDINRSLTGEGVRKTLQIIKRELPELKIKYFKSGTNVFDWKIPPEWNIKDAYIEDSYGNRLIDFKENNLHVIGYSIPINKNLRKDELLKNLYYLKDQPSAIPYITSYYKKRWGFCITYNQFKDIKKKYKKTDYFKILIDSNLKSNGLCNYGEIVLKGNSKKEILISTYICHPSMANNELSGPIVSMSLIKYFQSRKLNKTIRFIFIPETIGSIAYLSKHLIYLKKNVLAGYNLTCIGDERQHSCMKSKYENSPSDEAVIDAYEKLNIKNYKIYPFSKRGSDERQYNSPGIDLNITSIFRTKYHEYPEYHTSLDKFDSLVTEKGCHGGFLVAKESIKILQKRLYPKNLIICEPHMSKRKMYADLSIKKNNYVDYIMDFLQFADGNNSLEKISKLINLNLSKVKKINSLLIKKGIIEN